jgi:hypothetical protein
MTRKAASAVISLRMGCQDGHVAFGRDAKGLGWELLAMAD